MHTRLVNTHIHLTYFQGRGIVSVHEVLCLECRKTCTAAENYNDIAHYIPLWSV